MAVSLSFFHCLRNDGERRRSDRAEIRARAVDLCKKIYDKQTARICFEDKIIFTFYELHEKVPAGDVNTMKSITFVEETQKSWKIKISYNSY